MSNNITLPSKQSNIYTQIFGFKSGLSSKLYYSYVQIMTTYLTHSMMSMIYSQILGTIINYSKLSSIYAQCLYKNVEYEKTIDGSKSLFIYNKDTNSRTECVIFHSYNNFPDNTKCVKVILDDGTNGYLPLSEIGSDYDSGLRYTDDVSGKTYQICSSYVFNIVNEYFINDNYYINIKNYDFLYHALYNIFNSRVQMGTNCVYFTTPQLECGITKMFCIGLNIRITAPNENGSFENGVTITTYNNGLCDTSYDGDNKLKANALLVKLSPRTMYKIEFDNSYKKISYDDDNIAKNCIIFGKDVEKLSEYSHSYQTLVDTKEYFTTNDAYGMISSIDSSFSTYYEISAIKNMWLKYNHSTRVYNYYDLTNFIREI